jgi:hypothetical protein
MVGRGLRGVVFFGLRWRGVRGRHYGSVDITGEDLFVVGDGWGMTWARKSGFYRAQTEELKLNPFT